MTTPGKLFKKPDPITEEGVSADRLDHLAKGLVRYALKKVREAEDVTARSAVLASLLRATARVGERDLTLAGAIINQLSIEGVPHIQVHIAAISYQDDELIKQLAFALLEAFDGQHDVYEAKCAERAKEVWARTA